MSNYLNLEKLIRIKVLNFREHNWNKAKPCKKILGIVLRKGGIYCRYFGTYYGTVYDYLKQHPNETFDNGVLYFKPVCQLFFEDGHETNFYAQTKEEAIKKAEEIKAQSGKWITID